MFLSILQKIGSVGAWIAAIIIVIILIWLMWVGAHNRYAEADSAGWAVLLMPLFALAPLTFTVPFVIRACHHLVAGGSGINLFTIIPITIIVYACFFVSLVGTYNSLRESSPLIPLSILWISGTLLIGFMFYGLTSVQHGKLVFLVTGIVLSFFTLLPMLQTMHQLAKAKVVVTLSYGIPFNPKVFKEYEFQDFILKPSLETHSYVVLNKKTGAEENLVSLCAHNDELRTNCEDFSKGYGYKEGRIIDGGAVDGKYFVARPRGEMVVIEEK